MLFQHKVGACKETTCTNTILTCVRVILQVEDDLVILLLQWCGKTKNAGEYFYLQLNLYQTNTF